MNTDRAQLQQELVEQALGRFGKFRFHLSSTKDVLGSLDIDRVDHLESRLDQQSKHTISPLLSDLKVLASAQSFTVNAESLPSFAISNDNPTVDPIPRVAKRMRLNAGDIVKFYIRQYEFRDVSDLRQALHRYLDAYPGDSVWTTVCLGLLEDQEGKVYLHYSGMTCRDVDLRVEEDEFDVHRRICNWRNINPSTPKLFVYDSGYRVDSLELRDRPDLQNIERACIAVIYPSLNAARGGLHHPMLPHKLSPSIPNTKILGRTIDPWPYAEIINQSLNDARSIYATISDEAAISDSGFAGVVRHAQRGSLYNGVLLAMSLAKDITYEAMFTTRDDMGFSDRLTGPGPKSIDQARLQALGIDLETPGDVSVSLGPLVDLWALTIKHRYIWIAILHLVRYIYIVKPVLIRVFSAKVSSLLVNGCIATALSDRNRYNSDIYDAFFTGRFPGTVEALRVLVADSFEEPIWRETQTLEWVTAVGTLCIVDMGRRYALALLSYHGGILKYDPLLLEPLSTMLQLVALKGVKVEECVMNYVDLHGDPAGQENELSIILADATKECRGLDEEINKVKVEIERLNRLIVSERHNRRWKDQIAKEMFDGSYEEKHHERSTRSTNVLDNTRQFLNIRAQGPPESEIRISQFAFYQAEWCSRQTRGSLDIARPKIPRYYDHNDQSWQNWWVSCPEGLDLSLSAHAFNGHTTRYMSLEERKVYAIRLSTGKPPNHFRLAWLSNNPDRGSILQKLASFVYYKTSYRKIDCRIVSCSSCNGFAIGDHNIRHRCLKGEDETDQTKLSKIKAVATGLDYLSLVYPHDLVDHHLHGAHGWRECEENGLDGYLSDLGLVQVDACKILQDHWASVSGFIDSLDGLVLGKVTIEKESPDPSHVLAMAVDRYLQARATSNPPISGPVPGDSLFDDDPAYGALTTTLMKHMASSSKAMGVMVCSAVPSYGYRASRPMTAVKQHECPTLYGPLLDASGLSLTAHKAAKGKAGIFNTCNVEGAKIKSFFDLRIDIQRRLWEGICRDKDPIHDKVSRKLLEWIGI